jgi:hypothetical protein
MPGERAGQWGSSWIFKSQLERSRGPTSQRHAHGLFEWPTVVDYGGVGDALLTGDGLPVREYFAEPPGADVIHETPNGDIRRNPRM